MPEPAKFPLVQERKGFSTNGLIFDIQRFSVHDGPGVRTTVFLKGCPLRCGWCHNPEGLENRVQLQYREELCIGCGDCASACPHGAHSLFGGQHQVEFSRCLACGACAAACPSGALSLLGRTVSPHEVLAEARRDRCFYGKEGGVTFSGGECTMQPEFLLETLALCREAGLHTAVDTCGMVSTDVLDRVAERCDLFLYDIKAVSPNIHRAGTGAENGQILENYKRLLAQGKRVWVRVPVIGGFNASPEEMEQIAAFLHENPGAEQIELMPYHRLGIGKYAQLGRPAPEDAQRIVSHKQMQSYFESFRRLGLPVRGAKKGRSV